ncbi:hypothetical protein V6N12_067922 [Hibiscus sabdariffa]|uniref:Reverse transcriptase domain-containing protein n=1 Tax=Hibiscus sabdariffa TaxID=183260 RepID=A0ABR2FNF9_9ROSI
MNLAMCGDVQKEEITEAIFGLWALKAPGPNGFPCIFYQTWGTIKKDLMEMVMNFLERALRINKTNSILIPKQTTPSQVNHFRPISLYNFSYKVISKIMTNRLKKILPKIIHEMQFAFVNGSLIHDNIVFAHEAFHVMKRKRKRVESVMALKISLEKAYDKVDWECFDF